MDKIEISRTRDVKLPTRGTKESAGIDLYVPHFTDEFVTEFNEKHAGPAVAPSIYEMQKTNHGTLDDKYAPIFIPAHMRVCIPSGVRFKLPLGKALVAMNKSGVSTKKGLDVLACVIDSDYQGEMSISLVNTSNHPVEIATGDKIVQLVLLDVGLPAIVEVDDDKIFAEVSERGAGGFGSTGNE